MNRGVRILAALALAGALGASGLAAQEAGSGERISVQYGVYTEAQAERGEETYDQVCGYCHSTSQFSGSSFLRAWRGAAVGQFYGLVSTTMPSDLPASLTQQQYIDVIAYILSLNDFPAGSTELAPDRAALGQILIEAPSGEGEDGS